jgi:hypothetical protein
LSKGETKVYLFSASNLSILEFALLNSSRIIDSLKKFFVYQTKISYLIVSVKNFRKKSNIKVNINIA